MANQIKVIMVEAFDGRKYLIRTDKEYKKTLGDLFERLLGNDRLGSVACISLRLIDADKYNGIKRDPESVTEEVKKGAEDGSDGTVSRM